MQLAVHSVTKTFSSADNRVPVLKGVTVSFSQDSTYAITGFSGAGKSTLLHILAGIERPDLGTVYYNQQSLFAMNEKERAHFLNKKIGFIFQNSYLINELTVQENIMLKAIIGGKSTGRAAEEASCLLSQVGLKGLEKRMPATLSGGQQQRVAIARALSNMPDFILADEPTANLDVHTGKEIISLLLACHTQYQTGLIISSHDEYVYAQMKQVYTLSEGILLSL
jgi:ABC-type lipoprotein export system ATPase subunit